MNKLVERQLRKCGELSLETVPGVEAWQRFVASVDEAYGEFDKDRILLERSIELSSHELAEVNERLRKEGERQKVVLDKIQEAVNQMRDEGEHKIKESDPTADNLSALLDRLLKLIHDHSLIESQLRYQTTVVEDQKERLHTILTSIGDGVIVLDENKVVTIVNTATETLTGYSSEELIGTRYNEHLVFLSKKTSQEQTDFIDKVYAERTVATMPDGTVCLVKGGRELPVADSAAPIIDARGTLLGCVVVFRDVTREREIEQMKSEFVSVASHQLRTPLTGIKWLADYLSRGKAGALTPPQQDLVVKLGATNQRMIELVNDLLDVSRIETGKNADLHQVLQDIVPLWKEVAAEHQAVAEHQNVKIELLPTVPLSCEVMLDPQKIREVFNNLLSNAIKYSVNSGCVKIGIEVNAARQEVICSVKDNGIGIPVDQQNHIFEKFFRARNVILSKQEGTGLGLYIVKSIVEKHHGRLSFSSREGEGTTFFVTLPLRK